MELGVALPTSGRLASPANIVRIAQEAERLGYAAVWTYERLLRPMAELPGLDGRLQRIPEQYRLTYEPLETLSYVAGKTERVKLGTSVIDALLHPPVVLARRFATLDQLSGGRAVAGLGQGWMPQEFETANVPMDRIGAGMDEVVAAMRACWGPDPVEYQGRFHRITPLRGAPQAGAGVSPGAARHLPDEDRAAAVQQREERQRADLHDRDVAQQVLAHQRGEEEQPHRGRRWPRPGGRGGGRLPFQVEDDVHEPRVRTASSRYIGHLVRDRRPRSTVDAAPATKVGPGRDPGRHLRRMVGCRRCPRRLEDGSWS